MLRLFFIGSCFLFFQQFIFFIASVNDNTSSDLSIKNI